MFTEAAYRQFRLEKTRWICKQCAPYADENDDSITSVSPTSSAAAAASATDEKPQQQADQGDDSTSTAAPRTPPPSDSKRTKQAASQGATPAERELVTQLVDMGFDEAESLRALRARGNNITQAVEYLMRSKGASSIDFDQIDKLESRRRSGKRRLSSDATTPESTSKRRRTANNDEADTNNAEADA